MKISIITVCLNGAKTIEKTIQSVIGQSYPDLEYIIIDGGSTDGTTNIIEKYNRYIAYWVSEKDNGIYDAMNKGIAKATGEVIAFLNSDDWYEDAALEKAADYFKRYQPMVLTGRINTLQQGEWREYKESFDEIDENIRIGMTYRHPATFVRRELFDRFGKFDTRYKIAADYEWMLRIYDGGVKGLRVNTVFTNFSPHGISSVESAKTIKEAREIALCGLAKCRIYNTQEKAEWAKKINQFYGDQQAVLDVKSLIWNDQIGRYPDFKKLLSEYFSQEAYIVWGTGMIGKEVYHLLSQLGVEIKAFIDSKVCKDGEKLYGVFVKPSQILSHEDKVIVASIAYEEDIVNQLKEKGLRENINYILYSNIRTYMINIYLKNELKTRGEKREN